MEYELKLTQEQINLILEAFEITERQLINCPEVLDLEFAKYLENKRIITNKIKEAIK